MLLRIGRDTVPDAGTQFLMAGTQFHIAGTASLL